MRGFQNIDKVSCYVNAALRCLLHLNIIRKQLFNYDKGDILNLFACQYEDGMYNLNTYEIRQYLGEYFLNAVKRDAFEFLTALCTKYDYIKNIVEHQLLLVDAIHVVIQKLLSLKCSTFNFNRYHEKEKF